MGGTNIQNKFRCCFPEVPFVGPLDLDIIFASLSCMLDFVPNLDKKNLAAANFIAFSINMDTNSDCMICLNNIFFWILS